jgi:hypothetical protein
MALFAADEALILDARTAARVSGLHRFEDVLGKGTAIELRVEMYRTGRYSLAILDEDKNESLRTPTLTRAELEDLLDAIADEAQIFVDELDA